ncbi:MAG: efflux RND transporter periplasmic adaptor subunit [Armatimonadota bacterium]
MAAHDELISRMLTPRAQIRLGPGLANQERLMRRASNSSLSYTIRSLWAGIVEYVFPPHGLFRRGDHLARIYDPQLLADLERARERMLSEEVSPLTIAAHARRRAPEQPPAEDAEPVIEAAAPPATEAPVARNMAAASPPEPRSAAEPVAIPDFDFEANQVEQSQLKEQAELAAMSIPAAIEQCSGALEELRAAQDELANRHRLLEQGVLAEQALGPAQERVAKAKTAYERAEAVLVEAQEGYDRLADRIRALESDATAAHQRIQAAREARARRAEIAAQREEARARQLSEQTAPEPPTVRLERRQPDPGPGGAGESGATVAAEAEAEGDLVRVHRINQEARELAAPRWEDLSAESPGVVSEVLAPEGGTVEVGDELLRVSNLQLAQVTARVAITDLPHFPIGRSVTIDFEDYSDTVFGGWVAQIEPVAGTDEADVSLLVVCQSGRFANDAYLALRWMTLEAGVGQEKIAAQSLQPAMRPPRSAETDLRLARIFPAIAPRELYVRRATRPSEPLDSQFSGRLRLQPMDRLAEQGSGPDEGAQRLAALGEWRRTYIDGMATAVLDDGTCITYPTDGDVSEAVRLMLAGEVNHRPNLCAATMREALGWGLGDAHQWATRLPRVGYVPREDGLPRPGDILVWPFTYGPNRSQHIGFAVRQGRELMLLSNLSGILGTTEILDGYIAFYRPADRPAS